ncbi:MAG: sulfatase [Planctomycetes bacterium]|nr:sulfatase [Planctomycetota bacterium]
MRAWSCLALTLLLPAACQEPGVAGEASPVRPNIVFFFVDDMGWQDTSVAFHRERTALNDRYRTPNMERLAAEGIRFTQAYASAICSPSRVSLMTGMNAARHGVTCWTLRRDQSPEQRRADVAGPDWPLNGLCAEDGVPRTVVATTLPQLLREAGYHTIHAGKAHFGAKGTPGEDPRNLGFDVNIAGGAIGGPGSYWGEKDFSAAWRDGDRIWDVPGLEEYHGQDIFLTEAITREVLAELGRQEAADDDQPFYLYLSHYAVHAPLEADARYAARYEEMGLEGNAFKLATMLEGMDKSLGDVLRWLEDHGELDHTWVVFLADNGAPSQVPRNLPLRGHKITPYEGGTRVPMIVRTPGAARAGERTAAPVLIEDVFPSFLEVAGVEWAGRTRQTVDGVSFLPLVRGDAAAEAAAAERPFIWHYPNTYDQPPSSTIRVGDWKLIHHHAGGGLELFNLAEDLSETTDLAEARPAIRERLARRLATLLRERGALMPIDKATGDAVKMADGH